MHELDRDLGGLSCDPNAGSCPHMKNGLSPGDYLVLQSPIMQSAMLNDEGGQKQNSKPSVNKQQSPTNKSIRQQNTTSSPQKCTIEVRMLPEPSHEMYVCHR